MLNNVRKDNSIILAVDIQKDSTDPSQYLAKNFFNGSTSATTKKITAMWDFIGKVKTNRWKVLAIKLVHDLEKMKRLDKKRYENQVKLGLIKNNTPLIFKPGVTQFDFANSSYRPGSEEIYEKCSRSVCVDPDIMEAIDSYKPVNIVLLGIDSNVCVYESARDLSKNYNVIVLIDLVSTRPNDSKDFEQKRIKLEAMGVLFINSPELFK